MRVISFTVCIMITRPEVGRCFCVGGAAEHAPTLLPSRCSLRERGGKLRATSAQYCATLLAIWFADFHRGPTFRIVGPDGREASSQLHMSACNERLNSGSCRDDSTRANDCPVQVGEQQLCSLEANFWF